MNPADLKREVEGMGVSLWLEDGKLMMRGPESVLTEEFCHHLYKANLHTHTYLFSSTDISLSASAKSAKTPDVDSKNADCPVSFGTDGGVLAPSHPAPIAPYGGDEQEQFAARAVGRLKSRGIRPFRVGSRLVLAGPAHSITVGITQFCKEHKAEMLAYAAPLHLDRDGDLWQPTPTGGWLLLRRNWKGATNEA